MTSSWRAGRWGGAWRPICVAEGFSAAGVILYAYPLHPAGKEDRLRVAHFQDVHVPMLFFQGTRDALSRMELFDRHIRSLPNASVELLEGASHSFRGGGWTEDAMLDRLVAAHITLDGLGLVWHKQRNRAIIGVSPTSSRSPSDVLASHSARRDGPAHRLP